MSQAFYSPINKLAAELPRTKGTGAEFMTELSKRPGYKPMEAQDRDLQTLAALPKMERAQFLEALQAKKAVVPYVETLTGRDTAHEDWTLPGGKNYREILLTHSNPAEGGGFPGVPMHFHGAPNVLASILAKDRTGPNGEKILHLDEIQSDWHQQGRKKGYVPKGVDLYREANIKYNKHLALKSKLDEASSASNAIDKALASDKPLFQDPARRATMNQHRIEHNNAIMDLMPQVMRAEEEYRQAQKRAQEAVSDAPFKKNWHELALKKMIHHAAEKGYSHIAITPGSEVAKRYELSTHIGGVSYNPETQHFQAFKPNRETVINEKGATPERVEALIGESATKRLMQSPQTMGHHYIEGEDLDIGGEGMKGFYDKMVPDFLNKFGKKYGAKVGTMPLTVPRTNPPRTVQQLINEHGIPTEHIRAMSMGERSALLDQYQNKQIPMHSFPITPEMREDVVKNGVPLYAEGGDVSRETAEANKAKFLKGSKVPERVYHGTGNLENLQAFDPARTGKGNDQLGSGFYFSNEPDTANWYAPAVTGDNSPGIVAAHLAIRKPIKIGPKGSYPNDSNVKLTHDQVKRIMAHAPNLYDTNKSPLVNYFDLSKGVTPKMIHDVARYYTGPKTLQMLENDMFPIYPTEYRHALHNVLGYDGVIKDFGDGGKYYVAWFPNQVKSAIGNRGTYDPNNPDIAKAKGGSIKPVGYTRERVTVSPNLDQMRYELMSVKHYTKAK